MFKFRAISRLSKNFVSPLLSKAFRFSKKAAYDALKNEPQTQLCDEGIEFRSIYVEEE